MIMSKDLDNSILAIKNMSDETLNQLCSEINYRLENNLFDEFSKNSLESLLNYGKLTILDRAFPKVEDGLKPVHRRILYSMNDLSLSPTSPHKKCARIVGHIVGLYHPHGDTGTYDTLVRLAQSFSMREPLVEGQGNFGTIEGDSPAAQRYCVVGDTYIKMKNGLFKIKNMVDNNLVTEQDIDVSIFSLGNKINKADKFFNSGKHPIIKITTNEGYSISGSHNHPILTLKNNKFFWKTLENIEEKDIVVLDKNNSFEEIDSFLYKKTIIYASILKERTRKIKFKSEERKNKFIDSFKELYDDKLIINKNYIEIEKHSTFYKEKKEDFKYIPEFVMNNFGTHQLFIDFLLEGKNVFHSNRDFIKLLQILLLNIGIVSSRNGETIHLNKKNNTEYFFSSVKKINHLKEDFVYSIRVDNDCHSFIGNGIFNHNTEATVTKVGYAFFKDLDKDVVDFEDNYDETTKEPSLLPVKFPNLLINGTNGIAVGMSSKIPPHNPLEVLAATKYIVEKRKENKEVDLDELINIMPAPDFPTGGIVYKTEGMKEAMISGLAKLKLRAKYHTETIKRKDCIVITEIPYLVKLNTIFSKLQEIVNNKKEEAIYEVFKKSISDVRNESNKDGLRIVIDLKTGVEPEIIWNQLIKACPLDETVSYINNVIDEKGMPRTLGLLEMLNSFINFRLNVIYRKYDFIRKDNENQLEIILGYIKALDMLDIIIETIRNSDNEEVSFSKLVFLGFSERQAKAILNLRLGRLTKLEKENLILEKNKLEKTISNALKIMKSDILKYNEIIVDLDDSEKFFSRKERLTKIDNSLEGVKQDNLIKRESCLVHISNIGYILRENNSKRKNKSIELSENDFISKTFETDSHSVILFITKQGCVFGTKVFNISDKDKGKHYFQLFDLDKKDKVVSILEIKDFSENLELLISTKNGFIKKTKLSEYEGCLRKTGVSGISLNDDSVISAEIVSDKGDALIINSEGKVIRFGLDEIPSTGRSSRGVISMRFEEGFILDGLFGEISDEAFLFIIGVNGTIKGIPLSEFKKQKRAGKGVFATKLGGKEEELFKVLIVDSFDQKDLFISTKDGFSNKLPLTNLKNQAIKGIKGVKCFKKDYVNECFVIPKEVEEN